MSFFRGLFNRNQQYQQPYQPHPPQGYMPHGQRGMPQMQHPPRQQHPMQMPQRPPQMPPQQQMPQQQAQPYNDPSVRFEPYPGPAGAMPPSSAPVQAPPSDLRTFVQGENNSLLFYEGLAKAQNASEHEKEQASVILENKRQSVQRLLNFHRQVAGNFAPENAEVSEVEDFRSGVSFALMQESRLLKEAAGIYAGLKDAGQQQFMNSVMHNKVADIAQLISL